ncbi:MAG: UDP-N-acetylmuramate dehydrogenase [Planctomycetes bacterium]|nr:UDP-N-acetylmuramate dehydrogenase [Planctomycetota bacterium]
MPLACSDLGLRRNVPLGPLTTMKVGGPAAFFAEPRTLDELAAATSLGVPIRVLGAGADLLVNDGGVPDLVVRLTRMHARRGLYVEAGANLPNLVKETVAEGLGGLECLAGVPATVGGAVAMNAGGRHGEIGDAVRFVDVLEDGRIRRLSHDEVGFRYRGTALADRIVVGVEFDLRPDPAARARYEEILAAKKATQPLGCSNSGCMFRNPPGLSAGRLIDEAGLKGAGVGGARVSRKHANFFVNDGIATASDVFRLIDLVRDQVRRRTGIELELEVVVWGKP